MRMARIEFESETRVSALRNDEEVAAMRSSVVGREMQLMRQQEVQLQQTSASRTTASTLGNMERRDADMAILQEIRRVQALCDEKEGRLVALRDKVDLMRRDHQQLVSVNSRLQAQASATATTPQAGKTSDESWVLTGNSLQASEERKAEEQRRREEMDDFNELAEATADVDRLWDDRNASKLWYWEEEAGLLRSWMRIMNTQGRGHRSWRRPTN